MFKKTLSLFTLALLAPLSALAAAPAIPFTVTMSEPVTIGSCTGTACPYLSLNVDGNTRSAYCPSVTNSATLTCTYTATAGDLDLDGIGFVDTNLHANSISITDQNGNPLTNFAFTPPANISAVKVSYPSLSMDFTNGTTGRYTLNGTAYTSLASFLTASSGTFSRASTATYFDSTGTLQTAAANTPRFDYDPSTLAFKGLLIEETRTNMLTRSANFVAPWSLYHATLNGTSFSAPDGTVTAREVIASASDGFIHVVSTGTTFTTYTFSVYAKKSVASGVSIQIAAQIDGAWSGRVGTYNLVAGTSSTATGYGGNLTLVSTAIQNVGNGWYRCSITVTATGTTFNTAINPRIQPYQTPPGTIGDSVYIWGAQLEQASSPTSYIPTNGSAVTRSGDNLTVPTGTWFDSTQATLFSSAIPMANINTFFASLVESGANYLSNRYDGNNFIIVRRSSAGNADLNLGGIYSTGQNYKMAQSENSSGGAATLNGGAAVSNALPYMPSPTYLRVGGFTSPYNTHVKAISYYPSRASNTQLQLLTQ